MRAAILLIVMLLAPTASSAQIPVLSATPHQLRTMTPDGLGKLLFGSETPEFTHAWVEGPTRSDDAITIHLATTPKFTGYSGLCALKTGFAAFRWRPEARGEDTPAYLGATPWTRNGFLLTSDAPSLASGSDDAPCAQRAPFPPNPMPPTIFHLTYPGEDIADGPSSNAIAARFAVLTLIGARKAAQVMPVTTEECVTGLSDVPAACGDPAGFTRSFYLRQIFWLTIAPCKAMRTLCVDAAIRGLDGRLGSHLVVRTGETEIDNVVPPTIHAITVHGPLHGLHD